VFASNKSLLSSQIRSDLKISRTYIKLSRATFPDRDTHVSTHLSDSSPTDRWAAKHAIAHIRIWMPWYNCLPRMSHTPWFGMTWALFCNAHHQHVTDGSDIITNMLWRVKNCRRYYYYYYCHHLNPNWKLTGSRHHFLASDTHYSDCKVTAELMHYPL